MAKFKYAVTDRNVSISHEALPGNAVSMSVDAIPGLKVESEVGFWVVSRALKAIMQDNCAGDTPAENMDSIGELWATIARGEVPSKERAPRGSKLGLIYAALIAQSATKGKTLDVAQAEAMWKTRSDEQKKAILARPEMVALMAQIAEERAKATEEADSNFDGLFD